MQLKNILLTLTLFLFFKTSAQNLFANSSFEELNNCTEYHVDCAAEAWFNIPATNFLLNNKKAPKPLTGNMVLVIPVGSVLATFNKPRFVYTAFCCPLQANETYKLSLFINTANLNFNGLAFYFTEKEPTQFTINGLVKNPSFLINTTNIDADYKYGWRHISAEYTASGKEKFCIITTAGLPSIEYEMKNAMNKSGDIFYCIDDIIFKPVTAKNNCSAYDSIKKILYNQNYRHSENIKAFSEEVIIKPTIRFKNDTITIAGLLFDVGKANVTKNIAKILDSLVTKLESNKLVKLSIFGHTDNSGDSVKNEQLSAERANCIKEYILSFAPTIKNKLFAEGKGQTMPKTTNKTLQGRQLNRRVEIILTQQQIIQ